MTTHLIVNADDLGQSPGINRGIFDAIERGVVTSASLMVRWPAAEEASRRADDYPDISLGLHLDLGEWAFEGVWRALYEVVPLSDRPRVTEELRKQVDRFGELVGRTPTHLDSHQHVHCNEHVSSSASALAAELGVPLRGIGDQVCYIGLFYGQDESGAACPNAISPTALTGIIEGLGSGTFEIGCHPGYVSDLETMYQSEREKEVHTLCDPAVTAAASGSGVHLVSYAELESCPHCRAQERELEPR